MNIAIIALGILALTVVGLVFILNKSFERLSQIATRQQDFIEKNLNEKVVYLNPGQAYLERTIEDVKDEEDVLPEIAEMSPEDIAEFKEKNS